MTARKLGFGLATMATLAVPAGAAPLPHHGIFVYSSLCTSAQSGDAEGNRLMLIRDGDGDRAFWEWSDGPLEGPVFVTKLRIRDGTIAFDADIGSQEGTTSDGKFEKEAPSIAHYRGTITASAVRVGVGRHQETWSRVTNFAAKTGICR
jgi:hypothetical protein